MNENAGPARLAFRAREDCCTALHYDWLISRCWRVVGWWLIVLGNVVSYFLSEQVHLRVLFLSLLLQATRPLSHVVSSFSLLTSIFSIIITEHTYSLKTENHQDLREYSKRTASRHCLF